MSALKESIQLIKGVGPKRLKCLERIGIYTVEDLLYAFPRGYEDRRKIKKIIEIQDGDQAVLKVSVSGMITKKTIRKGLKIFEVPIQDDTGKAHIIFYNTLFISKTFRIGKEFYLYGKIKKMFGKVQIIHPDYAAVENNAIDRFNKIVPIYKLTDGLTQKEMVKLQKNAFSLYMESVKEFIPRDIIDRNKLCDIRYALANIHFPESGKALRVAKFRLIFEELLILQLSLCMIKNKQVKNKKAVMFDKTPDIAQLIHSLSFKLTNAQTKVLREIEADMEKNNVMNRMIQGDVGSGKTIVAIIALYKAVLSGYQGVLMAPTEILAEQHLDSTKKLLEPLGIKIELLTGSISKKKKEEILHGIKSGHIDILIGTHALIQEGVCFQKLGLVITDEQHRFGVKQRNLLSQKGGNPDVLVMTATPIPRTLALVLYGDLDISIIDELPAGRKKIRTYSVDETKRKRVYDFIRKEIEKGRQAYVVTPLIEESEKMEVQSAIDIYNELKNDFLKGIRIGLLHGKMKASEKEKMMRNFTKGEIKILVSTTVIEVGVNVPNASVMVVENSERFGLAQLHQLRGRVGRGNYQSYCILIHYKKDALSKEKMKVMEKTNDGFIIAEKDLELRGPGEFFGTKQHGLPDLKIANFFKHRDILKQVQKEVDRIIEEDPTLSLSQNILLKEKILDKFKNYFDNIC